MVTAEVLWKKVLAQLVELPC